MTTSQILQEARRLIEAGWCQGEEFRKQPDGSFLLPAGYEEFADFNDDPHTTKRCVLALFDRALIEVTK